MTANLVSPESSAPTSSATIESIPPEILEDILIKVLMFVDIEWNWRSALESLALVCQTWSHIARRLSLLSLNQFTDSIMQKALNRAKLLHAEGGFVPPRRLVLNLNNSTRNTYPAVLRLFGPQVEILRCLCDSSQPGEHELLALGDVQLNHVRELSWVGSRWKEVVAVFSKCNPLVVERIKIQVFDMHGGTDRLLTAASYPNLRYFDTGRRWDSIPCNVEDFGDRAPNLEELVISCLKEAPEFYARMLEGIVPGRLKKLVMQIFHPPAVQIHRVPALRPLLSVIKAKGWCPIVELWAGKWLIVAPDRPPHWWEPLFTDEWESQAEPAT